MRRLLITATIAVLVAGVGGTSGAARPDRFDEDAAWAFLERQVELGPRPAGSPASRRLAAILQSSVPRGRYQRVPGGLRNVVGTVRGRDPKRFVVVGAHYDTKDHPPGFVGANDGASGTAVVRQLARTIKPRQVRPTLVFVFFDGEESPTGRDGQIERYGLRGSKVAARAFRRAHAAIVLDFVGDRELSIPRERLSNRRLWARLRAAAARAGHTATFPPGTQAPVIDDHIPFQRAGVPAIDLIDLDFPCWHRTCDDMTAVSVESLDAVGETMIELLLRL